MDREIDTVTIEMIKEFPVHFGIVDGICSADGLLGLKADYKPNHTKTLIAGENIIAVDIVGGKKMRLDPMKNRFEQSGYYMSFLIDPPLLFIISFVLYCEDNKLGLVKLVKITVGLIIVLSFIFVSLLLYLDALPCFFPVICNNLSGSEFMFHSNYTGIYRKDVPVGSEENEPQIKAPRVTPLEGVYTYALQGIRGCGVENPQGFGMMNADL